ncbi:C45 family autoproteolytic acyltransferase/hydolase [Jiangella anatolica]|uniref:Acyl-coenzyme A--6-aminopenicillanic-acid-acyltransferase form n=1 Tax=Jiangella anatolica TaxID=2670374 RepID=A0A2W2B3A9_9ACTN|nr:C45 family peptidase [Jiangella anatolica]PZF81931.1 acyl-coenzyme A--6-aminopenicillanic-acid-acyltransferase form [Jiangella anatolica]
MTESIPFVELSGTARECGRAHGEAAADRIAASVEFYAELFGVMKGRPWSEVCARATDWIPWIESYLPEALDEIDGIAEGSGRRFEEILALNGRSELDDQGPYTGTAPDECTSFALTGEASGTGHTYCGQNWDFYSGTRPSLVALRIAQPGRPTIMMVAEAGQVGRHGANSAGLALNANGLRSQIRTRPGVPQTYIRRKVLNSWSLNEALRAVFDVDQARPNNLLLTHRDGFVIDVETTPDRHGWSYPRDGVLAHANHFVSFRPAGIGDDYRPSPDSLFRGERVGAGLGPCRQTTTAGQVADIVRATMSDHFSLPHSVCNHPDPTGAEVARGETLTSSLVDLTTGEYRFTDGPPCRHAYRLLPRNLYDGPATPE